MTISAKIIADSVSPNGSRITTLQLHYPRFIHSQVKTHRLFSSNSSSSRAVPVMKTLRNVWSDPVVPVRWGKNQPGMQAQYSLKGERLAIAKGLWYASMGASMIGAWLLAKLGAHKEIVNRVVEPFSHIDTIVTATEWANFFDLRLKKDAQPEIQALAKAIKKAMDQSKPRRLGYGEWHLPYMKDVSLIKEACLISAAWCARVSYLTHDGNNPNRAKDITLATSLLDSRHMSPFEHQAQCVKGVKRSRNFRGEWVQNREYVEQ